MATLSKIANRVRLAWHGLSAGNIAGDDWVLVTNGTTSKRIQLSEITDMGLAIAKGDVTGHYGVNKFGRNSDIGTSAEDIWDGGGDWTAPTTARIHDITSTSTQDDTTPSPGTGALTIRIYGLTSWSAAEVSEDVTMNGTADVATSNSYVIIHRMQVLTSGSSGPNVGTITATAAAPDSSVTAQINAGEGQTQMAIYGIPSTQTAYMERFYTSVNKSGGTATGGVDVQLLYNPFPDTDETVFLTKATEGLLYGGASRLDHIYEPPNKFAGPGIFKLRAVGSGTGNDVSGGFDLVLVDN